LPPTTLRHSWDRILQVKRPNQQCRCFKK